ncbi:MAG: ADP-ribose pyrophosphatase [Mycobacterium sp.]|jgi:ADP-ribose pyrophosphatase YjhB (NUDIX family)|nr:ADP-ribose pyrophosphatase [Mycobacterium sp.]MCW2746076.1 ADP-ribose pyrophosphatase [Mycobacterium sp.]
MVSRGGSVPAGEAPREARRRRGARPARRVLPAVEETSAGGVVVAAAGGPEPLVALIGKRNHRGRLLWSLPKGHVEAGESRETTAMREVAEETGIESRVLGPLGTIDYRFEWQGRRVHKTVHHFLLLATGGELSDADTEVDEVAWVPLRELGSRLAHDSERRLARKVPSLLRTPA